MTLKEAAATPEGANEMTTTTATTCLGSYTEGKHGSRKCRWCGRHFAKALRTADPNYWRMPRHNTR